MFIHPASQPYQSLSHSPDDPNIQRGKKIADQALPRKTGSACPVFLSACRESSLDSTRLDNRVNLKLRHEINSGYAPTDSWFSGKKGHRYPHTQTHTDRHSTHHKNAKPARIGVFIPGNRSPPPKNATLRITRQRRRTVPSNMHEQ